MRFRVAYNPNSRVFASVAVALGLLIVLPTHKNGGPTNTVNAKPDQDLFIRESSTENQSHFCDFRNHVQRNDYKSAVLKVLTIKPSTLECYDATVLISGVPKIVRRIKTSFAALTMGIPNRVGITTSMASWEHEKPLIVMSVYDESVGSGIPMWKFVFDLNGNIVYETENGITEESRAKVWKTCEELRQAACEIMSTMK